MWQRGNSTQQQLHMSPIPFFSQNARQRSIFFSNFQTFRLKCTRRITTATIQQCTCPPASPPSLETWDKGVYFPPTRLLSRNIWQRRHVQCGNNMTHCSNDATNVATTQVPSLARNARRRRYSSISDYTRNRCLTWYAQRRWAYLVRPLIYSIFLLNPHHCCWQQPNEDIFY